MDARRESDPVKNRTTTERKSERELVVTRTVARARLVFEAWTKAELFRRWWVPKSVGLTLLLLRAGCSRRGDVPWCSATQIRPWRSSVRTSK